MKVYVTVSVVCCGVFFVAALGLLALTSFHLWNDNDSGNVPIENSDEWIEHVISLIPICVIFMLLCVFSLWTILMKDKMKCFIAVLVLNFLCLMAAVYFAVMFSIELDADPISGDLLFNRTKSAILKSGKKNWLPEWLNSIQLKSKECCGIVTFRDWEEFWPELETQIPKSCCKDPQNTTTFCPSDLARIPFPGTSTMFIKTDIGCLDEINDRTKKNIEECFIYIILICCVIAIAEIAYFVQFYLQYIPKAGARDRYTAAGDKFFDDKAQGDDSGIAPASVSNDSYLEMSGFTASLQTSSGSIQNSGIGIDPDTGDKAMLGMSMNMASYDPIALSATTSSSGFPGRQKSLARMADQGMSRLRNFGSRTKVSGNTGNDDYQNQDIPVLAVVSSSSEMDQSGKKKKKHRNRNDPAQNVPAQEPRQEVFIAPDTTDDFLLAAPVTEAAYGQSASPTASLDDVGDQLADGTRPQRPATNSKDKKKFGLGSLGMSRRRNK